MMIVAVMIIMRIIMNMIVIVIGNNTCNHDDILAKKVGNIKGSIVGATVLQINQPHFAVVRNHLGVVVRIKFMPDKSSSSPLWS